MDRSVVWINDVAKLSQDKTKGKPIKSSAKEKVININKYHCALGHPSKATPCATAKAFGVRLVGQMKPCEDCALRKAELKRLAKYQSNGPTNQVVDCVLTLAHL
jgi:hypothetical protein